MLRKLDFISPFFAGRGDTDLITNVHICNQSDPGRANAITKETYAILLVHASSNRLFAWLTVVSIVDALTESQGSLVGLRNSIEV